MGKDYGTGNVITAQTAYRIEDGQKITAPVVSSAGVLNVRSGGTALNVVESGGYVNDGHIHADRVHEPDPLQRKSGREHCRGPHRHRSLRHDGEQDHPFFRLHS